MHIRQLMKWFKKVQENQMVQEGFKKDPEVTKSAKKVHDSSRRLKKGLRHFKKVQVEFVQ